MFNITALGGTFDIIHVGHIELIQKAVSISDKIIIGLTSDAFISKNDKKIINNFEQRSENLEKIIHEKFPDCSFEIAKLDDDFGPAVIQGDVDALVVSEETSKKGAILNALRKERKLDPVEIIIVPMKMASDGNRISSTRIRNSEIDSSGNILVD
ncbi:pantetheine-phosphate adenylyltransferase [Candidatus Nitrosopelagicus sp.]|jgi:pantetheine-phosphate adenylyltransferase|nr:pantetheine-phosphate adenylyltransferase [Candidatus Nitrosopelagicus sp.]MDC0203489.1 pantetheine-phosphate adenylyltransferase [Candidatus Nitrosopelagicus sp.]|tara:strand:- start:214 stop:678 length:465 start_codon:yes stop_codon:yes gene_type:complete